MHESENRNKHLESRLEALENTRENSTAIVACDKCDLIFKNESKLSEHTIRTHEDKTEEENVSASTVEFSDENLTEENDKVYQCICIYSWI